MNTAYPLVSVIVPTFNRPTFLKDTLDSILAQTYTRIEVIVVDNYSSYDFFGLMGSFQDERIKPFQIVNNGVVAVNRNFGISRSKGDYIAFCDDDDAWMKTKLERQLEAIRNSEAKFVFSGFCSVDSENRVLSTQIRLKTYQRNLSLASYLFSPGFMCNSSVLFERSIIDEIGYLNEDPVLRAVEDYEYFSRIISKFRGVFVPEALVRYRVHEGSISMSSNSEWLRKQVYLHRYLMSVHRSYRPLLLMKLGRIYLRFCETALGFRG